MNHESFRKYIPFPGIWDSQYPVNRIPYPVIGIEITESLYPRSLPIQSQCDYDDKLV